MTALWKAGRLFCYLSDPKILRARIGRYNLAFVEELLTLRRNFGLSFNSLVDVGAREGQFIDAFRLICEALQRRFAGVNCTLYPYALAFVLPQ
jgi:hypothetical protein